MSAAEQTNNVEIYNNFLKKYFGDKSEEFKNVLKESKAVVAGGSVLAAFMNNKDYNGDIDIYVNVSNAEKLRNFLASFRNDIYISKRNSDNRYATFFLGINKIARIVRFEFGKSKSIDLVYISNSKTPNQVVNNFDFTCCQVWFDGDNITASHPEDTLMKKATINKDYMMFYTYPDKFARKRMDKYESKGFEIQKYKGTLDIETPVFDTDVSDKELGYHYLFGWTFNYCSFVSGINKNYFRRCKFNSYEPPNVRSLPLLVKNNMFIFNSDIFDEKDFTSLEDYKKVDMYDKAVENIKIAIKYINAELKFIHQRDKKFRVMTNIKEALMTAFGDIIGTTDETSTKLNKSSPSVCGGAGEAEESVESIIGKSDNAYPEIETTCWVESLKNDIPMGLYLSDKDNIVIKHNNSYLGYRRDFIIRKVRTNKVFENSKVLDVFINKEDINRLDNHSYKYFEIVDSGLYSDKVGGAIYNVVPYTVKILKKHLKI